MSAPSEQPKSPRLVTRAAATPEHTEREASRYAADPTAPNPVVRADAMGSTVLAHLITGPLLFGGIGWLIDRWLGITGLVAVGIIGGMGLSLYVIWLRYGTSEASAAGPRDGSTRPSAPHNEENP